MKPGFEPDTDECTELLLDSVEEAEEEEEEESRKENAVYRRRLVRNVKNTEEEEEGILERFIEELVEAVFHGHL